MTTQNTGSIGYEIIAMKRACETTPYLRPECEYDGWPLETTPDGLRHCRFCGATYPKLTMTRDVQRP